MAKFEGKLSVTPYFLHHYLDNNGAGMLLEDKLSSTLLSKATATSKTFIVPKVFSFGYPDWFCLKAHDLPFTHAKFHSSGSSSLAST